MASTSSAPDVPESSRAGQQAAPQRKWVALVSAAVFLADKDEPLALAIGDGADVLIDHKDPPLPTQLVLHPRVAPNPRRNDGPLSASILAAYRSDCLLLEVVEGTLPDFFLCNTRTRTVSKLPPVISATANDIRQHRSMGLITDPLHPGHYVVAQLHPSNFVNEMKLVHYSTAKGKWFVRGFKLQQAPMRNPLSETGVLAHDGRLWWVALAYGVFFCDPFAAPFDAPKLRFLPLPEDCEMQDDDVAFDPRIRTVIDQRRCIRLSEGKLRFVEIRGLSYDKLVDDVPEASPTVCMWTLEDPERQDPWTHEYEVAFAEIWDNKTYAELDLPREVLHVALVDPTNHFVVYFFQGSKLFGFDMSEKKFVGCRECPVVDRDQVMFRSSRPIIDAWVPPPPLPKLPGDSDDSSPAENVVHNIAHDFLGSLCTRNAFCSICLSAVCLTCCPGHKICHHGDVLGGTLNIYITKDGPAVDAIEIRRNGFGYNWNLIQRRRDKNIGQMLIMLHSPPEDQRNKSKCLQCNQMVKSKSEYCGAACKALHKPNGQSTQMINALVEANFDQAVPIDDYCQICMRVFAREHCSNHQLHHHKHVHLEP